MTYEPQSRRNGKLAAKIGAGAAALTVSLVTVWEGYMPMLSTPDALRTWCKRAIRKARSFCGSSPNGTSCRFLGAPSAVEVSASKNTARDTIFFRDVNPCASVRSPQRTTRVSRLSSSVGPSTIIRFVVTVIVNSIYRKIIVIAGRQCPNFELFVCFPCRANLYSAAIISCISDQECASSLGLQAGEGKREARQGFFGRHRSISNRSAGTPAMRTFSHCERVSRSVPCTNSLSGATGGRPVFFRSSMPELSVAREQLASVVFSCHNNAMQTAVKTLKIRIKDKHASVLRRMARDVNQVFNFANETSSRAIRERGKWLSAYDLQKLTAGYSRCDGVTVGSGTVQLVCVEYATRRKQFKKTRLNWRVSNPKSPKYSLGWIPFKGGHAKYKSGQVQFGGHKFSLWDSYGLSRFELRAGSFNEDSRGRWYFNVAVEVEALPSQGASAVGIDLGLKECATTSDGDKLQGRWFRELEPQLAVAQRARKKKRVKAIHAKIANRRKDAIHKFTTNLVKNNAAIFVGDVASAKLVKTKMAKSTLDAGWAMFKTALEYKCRQAGVVFEVVNEAYSTQACSSCGSVEGPRGSSDLGIRRWTCSCGAEHDRDVNAAKNIARFGLESLAVGAQA